MIRTLTTFFMLAALAYAQSPEWFLQGSAPDPGGRAIVGPGGKVLSIASAVRGTAPPIVPGCHRATVCGNRFDGPRSGLQRVEWKQTMGYTFAYPVDLSKGGGGVSAVGIDSKGNLWAFQRNAVGEPQLFEFGPDRKLLRTIGEDAIGHQEKAHGMAIDADDNVWICDANGSNHHEAFERGAADDDDRGEGPARRLE